MEGEKIGAGFTQMCWMFTQMCWMLAFFDTVDRLASVASKTFLRNVGDHACIAFMYRSPYVLPEDRNDASHGNEFSRQHKYVPSSLYQYIMLHTPSSLNLPCMDEILRASDHYMFCNGKRCHSEVCNLIMPYEFKNDVICCSCSCYLQGVNLTIAIHRLR